MNITITLNGTNPKEAFVAGGFWAEYSKHCSKCGCCGSDQTIPTHRLSLAKQGPNAGKKFDQYEAKCLDCGATFAFGQQQNEQKSLYPGKMDKATGQVNRQWKPAYSGGNGGSHDNTFSNDGDTSDIPF